MTKACFLDRDGVINEEVNYLHDPAKAVLIPGAAAAINRLHAAGYLAIVVTNQAGVAKGLYEEKDIRAVHDRIAELLAADGAEVDAFFYCPHHPDYTGACGCRKPSPGMLLAAAAQYDIELDKSLLVGDRLSDIEAGRAAGCQAVYLVATGYGAELLAAGMQPDCPVADDLKAAVDDFLSRQEK